MVAETAPSSHPQFYAPGSSKPREGYIKHKVGDAHAPCVRCGELQLERRHRETGAHWILSYFSIFPYQCAKCFHCQLRFVPTAQLLQPIAILLLLGGNIAFVGYRIRAAQMAREPAAVTAMSSTRARVNTAGLTPFERMMLDRKKQTLRNDDIILLSSSGVETSLLIKMISLSNGMYDLSPRGVLQLKRANVNQVVIEAMMDHTLSPESASQ